MNRVVDLGGMATEIRATEPDRVEALEVAFGMIADTERAPELVIALGGRGPEVPDEQCDLADGAVRAWWRDDILYLARGDVTAQVSDTEAHVGGGGDFVRSVRQLLPYITTQLLAAHGRFVLHGGAAQRDGQAVVVLGASGSGKSTAIAGALSAGWDALSDDLVVVCLRPDGPIVTGIAKPIAVPGSVAHKIGLPARAVPGDPRERWELLVDVVRGWYPVASTLVAGHGSGPVTEWQPLDTSRLAEWLFHAFLARHDVVRLRSYLPVVAALTRQGGWELRHGTANEQRIPAVAGLFECVPPASRERT